MNLKFITFSIFLLILISTLFSQTNDEEFNSFWKKFKKAVTKNEKEATANLTNFPFIKAWLMVSESSNKYDRQSFITDFDAIFPDKEIFTKVKYNKDITYKKKGETINLNLWKDENGDFILNYTITFEEAGLAYFDYTFTKINGEYKLTQLIEGD